MLPSILKTLSFSVTAFCCATTSAQDLTPIPAGEPRIFPASYLDGENGSAAQSVTLPDGRAVVIWAITPTTDENLFAQIVDLDGQLVGEPVQITTAAYKDVDPFSVSAVVIDNGNLVISWDGRLLDDPVLGQDQIFARVFDASLQPVSERILVSAATSSENNHGGKSNLTALANGGFMVGYGYWNSSDSVLQAFASDGSPAGEAIMVANGSADDPYNGVVPAIAELTNGNIVFAWESAGDIGEDNQDSNVMAKILSTDGSTVVGAFTVNAKHLGYQLSPWVRALSDGNFSVVWFGQEYEEVWDGDYCNCYMLEAINLDDFGISMRTFSPAGTPLTDEITVNLNSEGLEGLNGVTVLDNDVLAIAWASGAETTFGQLVTSTGHLIGGEFELNPRLDDGVLGPYLGRTNVTLLGDNLLSFWYEQYSMGDKLLSSQLVSLPVEFPSPLVTGEVRIDAINANTQLTINQEDLLSSAITYDFEPLGISDVGLALGEGTLEALSTSSWLFTPPADWTGNVELGYSVSDGDNNVVTTAAFNVIFFGTSGNDGMTLTPNDDMVNGLRGDDKIYSAGGDDTVYGGAGVDLIYGQAGNDILLGGDGNDTLVGGLDRDALIGDAGDDALFFDLFDFDSPILTPTYEGGSGLDLLIVSDLVAGEIVISDDSIAELEYVVCDDTSPGCALLVDRDHIFEASDAVSRYDSKVFAAFNIQSLQFVPAEDRVWTLIEQEAISSASLAFELRQRSYNRIVNNLGDAVLGDIYRLTYEADDGADILIYTNVTPK